MIGQQIIQEIDKTLDQLIRNAEAISNANFEELAEIEVMAFQKTQESLLQHLLHMDQCLSSKQSEKAIDPRSASNQVREKRDRFEKLQAQYSETIEEQMSHCPILNKRRKKRFFDLSFRPKKIFTPLPRKTGKAL